MKAKPKYIKDEAPVEQEEKELGDLVIIIDEAAQLQQEKEGLNKRIKDINAQMAERESLALELMEDAGIGEFKTESGHFAKKREFVNAKIEDNAKFLADLQERGEEGLVQIGVSGVIYADFESYFKSVHGREFSANEVKLTVHYQRLQSYVKERGEENEPEGLNINRFLTVKIKRRK